MKDTRRAVADPEVICSGYLRVGGVVLHAEGCPVLIAAGDATRRTHSLTPACERFYRLVNGLRVEGRADGADTSGVGGDPASPPAPSSTRELGA